MTFYTFMMRNHQGKDTPEGDLAADMKRDKERFPKNGTGKFRGWYRLIRGYLVDHNACDDCLATFDACWKEYELCERKRLKRSLRVL